VTEADGSSPNASRTKEAVDALTMAAGIPAAPTAAK
jgi:hypothetical protein